MLVRRLSPRSEEEGAYLEKVAVFAREVYPVSFRTVMAC